eukprot:CAMPEP_0116850134 /NCGR_PEP_ID=MMETSP0418-20121206/15987_1 /TAXON_ID=1158023 /ORGANISM="Astrosyne radiata, Strain 13vi08-1A" /LENGTH=852 /DNA_ID=CAMNT_0004481989 /DNA_START=64 /DNA_END=2622 /DNA_ORIENTATION=+
MMHAEEKLSAPDPENGKVDPPEEARSSSSRSQSRNRRIGLVFVFVFVVVVIMALVIGLSVGLTNDNKDKGPDNVEIPEGTDNPNDGDDEDGDPNVSLKDAGTFNSASGVFNVTLPLFGRNLATPYTSNADLAADLTEILKLFVNNIIKNNAMNFRAHPPPEFGPPAGPTDGTGGTGGEDEGFESVAAGPPSADGATDFRTNNQEDGVDEADLVKSDGVYVYAAYGDVLVIWNAASGELITNVTFPSATPDFPQPPPGIPGRPPEGEIGIDAASSFAPGGWYNVNIQGLLLSSSRLVVILNGYGQSIVQELSYKPAFYDAFGTRIVIFDTSSLDTTGTLTKVHETDIQGSYRDGRSVGDNVHLVTTSGFDLHERFWVPLDRYNPEYSNMNDEQYENAAKQKAEQQLIPSFVSQVLNDISVRGNPTVARVGLWQTDVSNNSAIEEMIYSYDPAVNTYTQIASFDITDDSTELQISMSGAFMPSSWGYTYTVSNMLVFAAQGWNWIPSVGGTGETTYFMGFSLNGDSSAPGAVGSLPGYLLNQYSMDIFDGHLRVATTIQSFWTVPESIPATGETEPMPVDNDEMAILPIQEWITQNQVVILKIPTLSGNEPAEFDEVGRIPDLGKEGEVFTAVRFFDQIAYVVTFERTDPFYVLNLTDPVNPGVLGELNITGFSSYLHSMNANNTLLLAVGQEADENGRQLGVQITLFDATDPTNPVDLDRYVAEQDLDTWSSSSVEFDFKAFRYLELGVEVGILILPLYINSWNDPSKNFDGFVVYDISRQGISQRFNITHARGNEFYGCYYWARLPERSLVFNGNVTTLKGHSVLSTDLDSGEERWKLDLLKPADSNYCHFW